VFEVVGCERVGNGNELSSRKVETKRNELGFLKAPSPFDRWGWGGVRIGG
jgi:hypothetical protein